MTGEERKERLSHKQAKILMILTTATAPIAAIPATTTIGEVTTVSNVLAALIWHLGAPTGWVGWGIRIGELSVLDPGQMIGDMLWTLPTLPFAYKVIQYLEGQSSRIMVYVTAIISIIVPLVLGI